MRTHQRVILANIPGGGNVSYTVPAGVRDVVSSVVFGNDAVATDVHYKVHVISGATDVVAMTSLVGGTAFVEFQPWITLEAGDRLQIENTGGGGAPDLHAVVGVIRYTL